MATFPPAVHDVFALDDLLTPEERALRYKVRAFMVRERGRERERRGGMERGRGGVSTCWFV